MHQRSTQGLHKRNASSHPWFKSHVRRLQDAELEVTQQPSQNEEKQVGSSVRQPVEVSFFLNGCQDAKKPCPDRGVFSSRRCGVKLADRAAAILSVIVSGDLASKSTSRRGKYRYHRFDAGVLCDWYCLLNTNGLAKFLIASL